MVHLLGLDLLLGLAEAVGDKWEFNCVINVIVVDGVVN